VTAGAIGGAHAAGERIRRLLPSRTLAGFRRLSLAKQFLFASLGVLLVGLFLIGSWVGQLVESQELTRTGSRVGLYVNGVISNDLQMLSSKPWLDAATVAKLDALVNSNAIGEHVVAFKVWTPDGQVVYSPNRSLIGRRYPIDSDLADALKGKLTADVTDLKDPENEYERGRWHRLLQVYAPLQEQTTGRIIGSVESYQLPDALDSAVRSAQLHSWGVVAAVMLGMYALLAGIVKRGSDTIGRQQAALGQKVVELSSLLDENTRLHERVRQAAGRTTTLNERALRRISADLHDGPGQALGLALLRLDSLQSLGPDSCQGCNDGADFGVVHQAVRDALDEVRTISAGLRLPVLKPLSPIEVVERVVRDHQRRSGTTVQLELRDMPRQAPLPVKIGLYRTLQESLSNATRHGGGAGVAVRCWASGDHLHLNVSDAGPGFDPARVPSNGHLGLAGMRERAELLGGAFAVESSPGHGATVRVSWPLTATDEEQDG
jgi:signal transduction histidine kinase